MTDKLNYHFSVTRRRKGRRKLGVPSTLSFLSFPFPLPFSVSTYMSLSLPYSKPLSSCLLSNVFISLSLSLPRLAWLELVAVPRSQFSFNLVLIEASISVKIAPAADKTLRRLRSPSLELSPKNISSKQAVSIEVDWNRPSRTSLRQSCSHKLTYCHCCEWT